MDVGGAAGVDQIKAAFQIITQDPSVKAIMVNIFGGIMSCEAIAQGIVQATNELHLHIPLIIRLQGNKVKEGRKIMEECGLDIIIAEDLEDAADKTVSVLSN